MAGTEGELQRIFGTTLRARCHARRLSQEALVEWLGFHHTYTGGLERGECKLRLRRIEPIAAQTGVEPLVLSVEAK